VLGWTCFLVHHHALQVAVFTAASAIVTERLLDAILATSDAASARAHVVCVRDAAPDLRVALGRRGFDALNYRYLSVKPMFRAAEASPGREWRQDDFEPLARLCARAYPGDADVRAFAPLGTEAEWRDYVFGLLAGPGCGTLVPSATFVVDAPSRGELAAAIITTDLGLGTGHIAQVAVDPDARRLGLGTELVGRALGELALHGYRRATLLVSAANAPAMRLYSRLGFRNRAAFVVGVNRQPRRLTSVALATGGASTRLYAASVVSPRSRLATAVRLASSASASADSDA
jgi:ribosomal protein S18 acetylase RimI-like enzyme